jgi:acyl-CoA reductase-like NAD-dependent aldehyde dehydrogenase
MNTPCSEGLTRSGAAFDDEADAIRMANDTPYGPSGSLRTRDLG